MKVSRKYSDGSFGVTFDLLEVKAILKNAIREHVKRRTGMTKITSWYNLNVYTTPTFIKGQRPDPTLGVTGTAENEKEP